MLCGDVILQTHYNETWDIYKLNAEIFPSRDSLLFFSFSFFLSRWW